MGVSGGRVTRQLDPWRRAAAAATGAAAVLLLLGPVYVAGCSESLRTGNTPTLCMVGWTFAGLVVLPIAGLLAGIIGRGLIDWLVLLAGAVLGGIVGGQLSGDADRLMNPAVHVMVALSVGYWIGFGIARLSRPRDGSTPQTQPAGRATIAMAVVMIVLVVASAVVVAQMPGGWERPLGTLGPATGGVSIAAGVSYEPWL